MATETGYMIVRADYSTFDSSVDVNPYASPDPAAGKDATPPTTIDSTFTFTLDGVSQTEDYPFEIWTDLVTVCNVMVQHYLRGGNARLLEISYDTANIAGDAFPGLSGYLVTTLDTVSEIDETTIRATATVT